MPSFVYRGRDGNGQMVSGVIEGATAGAVADTLFGSGVSPIEIKPTSASAAKAGEKTGINISLFKEKVGHIDVLLFSRQIHTLLRAGVPIMRALVGLQESSTKPAMREVLQDVRQSLDSGRDFSQSLARHPKVFTPFYLSMVRVGEMTGRLEEVFIRLFDHLEFERFMKEQVKSALRYPSFVVAAMAIAMFVVNIFVIPAFAKVFKGFNTELPLMTRILIGFSDFMVACAARRHDRRFCEFQRLAQNKQGKIRLGSFQAAHPDRRQHHPQGDDGAQRRANHPGSVECGGNRG